MDELEDLVEKGDGVNFVPCIKWVRRGVAKSQPERVKLTQEELMSVIEKTKTNLTDMEGENPEEEGDDDDQEPDEPVEGKGDTMETIDDDEDDIAKKYDMDNYDDEDEDTNAGGLGDLISHANPRDDQYLINPDLDDDASDIEDFEIKPSDNLLLVGHVDGNASILEVYVYNEDEDTLYVHHDILLPSFPMTLEWMNFEPDEETQAGNYVAIGSMNPIIDVWDIDVVDSLEPAFSLGRKGSKKKGITRIGHKDAVLSLSWNQNARHLLASGSVDETVLIWDMREGKQARTIRDHKEKVQALQWHPQETHVLLTGCCDGKVRLYDCNQSSHKKWFVNGEVEKVLWNHFNPFQFLACTDQGFVHMYDARNEGKSLWTLSAHTEGVNGITLSSQCPGLLVTGSSDKTMKVWDISNDKPTFVVEKEAKIGMVHTLDGCPDAPFVIALGGDTPSHNLHVMDVRESSAVNQKFNASGLVTEQEDIRDSSETPSAPKKDETVSAFEQMSVSGGAAGKFKKKDKKKKKKNNF